jgi:D-alanyl-D-alanine carboxypeptidase/D-alanyl-D-alanine-endopeptidase (penicillin-binding protein 4)
MKRTVTFFKELLIINSSLLIIISCSVQKQIAKSAKADVLDTKALQTAHVGISIFDPATNKYLYNYQGDKYFVPASNTKLPTCYAAMKYLGDSLVGLRYSTKAPVFRTDFEILGSGDPTFLHPDFKTQPVLEFFQSNKGKSFAFNDANWSENHLGSGWSWSDYDASYMAERSPLPIYGNVVTFTKTGQVSWERLSNDTVRIKGLDVMPSAFKNQIDNYDDNSNTGQFSITRSKESNRFEIRASNTVFTTVQVPFINHGIETAAKLLADSIWFTEIVIPGLRLGRLWKNEYTIIHSQPTDSLLKPMMHRSDNFFAEQSLLMVSNERLGIMNDEKIIDTLLKTDFKDLPQKPRWVDGSGLSRYNLFTPQDLVAILNKMKNEFGMERIKVILPTGGEGTISSYYKADSGYIYGKTGTLSGVVAFSGFLYTKKGKLLIFSTLVNNHQASATEVRRAVEKFLQGIRNKY